MKQNEQGALYPFCLSGSRMRQGAVMLRRQGRALDALSLLRRAAEQDDTPAAWYALAAELVSLSNWEAAMPLLARVLSRDAHQPGVWLDMARCLQALGEVDSALDCVYRQLQEDPWSPEGDAARAMLADMHLTADDKEPRRTQLLFRRGADAVQHGDFPLGERRIRRAMRIAKNKMPMLVSVSALRRMDQDDAGAMKYICRALRHDPEDARVLTALASLFYEQGRERLGRAFLQRAGAHAVSVPEEANFLSAVRTYHAWQEAGVYLEERLKRQPYRKTLLYAQAQMHALQGDMATATLLWREILAIDPDDRYTATLVGASKYAIRQLLGISARITPTERARQRQLLEEAAATSDMATLLKPGSHTRRLMDWFIAGAYEDERSMAMAMLDAHRAETAVIAYMKELLCQPLLPIKVRQWVLLQLAETAEGEEMLLFSGGRFSQVSCQRTEKQHGGRPWRMFLSLLLTETRQHRKSREIAEFAAAIWQALPLECCLQAASTRSYAWCKAMELLFLSKTGDMESARRVLLDAAIPARKIKRVLRTISRCVTAATDNGCT